MWSEEILLINDENVTLPTILTLLLKTNDILTKGYIKLFLFVSSAPDFHFISNIMLSDNTLVHNNEAYVLLYTVLVLGSFAPSFGNNLQIFASAELQHCFAVAQKLYINRSTMHSIGNISTP